MTIIKLPPFGHDGRRARTPIRRLATMPAERRMGRRTLGDVTVSAEWTADRSGDIIANMEDLYRDLWVPKYGKRWADWRLQTLQFIAWRWAWPVMWLLGANKLIKLG